MASTRPETLPLAYNGDVPFLFSPISFRCALVHATDALKSPLDPATPLFYRPPEHTH